MSATIRANNKRNEYDSYPTPAWCIEAIARGIVWGDSARIFEPCAGEGAVADVLVERDCGRVLVADINPDAKMGNGVDFLKDDDVERYDFIITNPPFSLAQEFVEKSLSLANCVVMLLPLSFLGSQKR